MSESTCSKEASSSSSGDRWRESDLELQTLVENGRNAKDVYCPLCPSKVLRAGVAVFVGDAQRPLPKMNAAVVRSAGGDTAIPIDCDEYRNFWKVDDVFAFENVGYTKTVAGTCKYLTCADCECGPLGVQMLNGEFANCSFVALARVSHR